jgi:hypothetical protein
MVAVAATPSDSAPSGAQAAVPPALAASVTMATSPPAGGGSAGVAAAVPPSSLSTATPDDAQRAFSALPVAPPAFVTGPLTLGATSAASTFAPLTLLPVAADAASPIAVVPTTDSAPSGTQFVTLLAQGPFAPSPRVELQSSDDSPSDPPIASDEDAGIEPSTGVELAQARSGPAPRVVSPPLSRLLPELSGMLSRVFAIDVNTWDRAVSDLLEEAGQVEDSLLATLDNVDLLSWILASSATAVTLEITQRESRRARLDASLPWGDELLGEVDP